MSPRIGPQVVEVKSNIEFRPEAPEFLADPFPLYHRLRQEDPVHWSPRLKAWVLTRYDDVRQVLLEPGVSSDRMRPFFATLPSAEAARIGDIIRYLSTWMVFRDPPEHTRLRRLTSKVFHLQSMNAMRSTAEELVEWLFGNIRERIGDTGEIDFIADFAGLLPALVIMSMLGVPREALAKVKRMSDDMALFIGSSRMSPEKYVIAEAATHEMADFFRELIQDRKKTPRSDLLSQLVHLEDNGDRLTEDELIATCILLLFAGHETTTNHIANGMLSLLRFPGELQALRQDASLAPRAIEELLRYDGPSGAQVRIVKVEQEMCGKRLQPGERVFLMLNAANRDPEVYAQPDRLQLARGGPAHLSFGFGLHICLGFPLARMEGQVALPAVLKHWPRIELSVAEARLEWLNSMVFRGMKSLPLRVGY
ncbi:MAG: cytochrome P450 [Betaproteobacteria bacterium]|nr:cytochrome P450 [Betaproteobacteria bacterium]MSQ87750.1 cytochrome P450 [Betaproteobacteria bacterium]